MDVYRWCSRKTSVLTDQQGRIIKARWEWWSRGSWTSLRSTPSSALNASVACATPEVGPTTLQLSLPITVVRSILLKYAFLLRINVLPPSVISARRRGGGIQGTLPPVDQTSLEPSALNRVRTVLVLLDHGPGSVSMSGSELLIRPAALWLLILAALLARFLDKTVKSVAFSGSGRARGRGRAFSVACWLVIALSLSCLSNYFCLLFAEKLPAKTSLASLPDLVTALESGEYQLLTTGDYHLRKIKHGVFPPE